MFDAAGASATGLKNAINRTTQGLNYSAPQAAMQSPSLGRVQRGLFDVAEYAPGQIASTNLAPYMNKYDRQVINRATRDMNRARQMTQNDIGASATAAGAFGGSRHGLVEAENNRNFARATGDMAANMRQQSFMNAQNMANEDIRNQMAGQGLNMGALNSIGGQRLNVAGMGTENNQFNASNQMGANQMGMNAASQLAGLSGDAFGRANYINNNMMSNGTMQQSLMQSVIDAAKGQYAGYAGAPTEALNAPLAALGVTPSVGSQTTSQKPGLFNYLSLLTGLL